MEEALNNTKSTKERLKINSDENDIKDPNLNDHADQCDPQCEVTFLNCKNPEFSENKQLTNAEGHTSFIKRVLSNCTYYDNDLKKIQLGEDGGKPMNGSSSKTVILHATGVKNSVCPSNILNSVGNDESCLDIDIQREEEVACHLLGQSSLETMRERFASYISYSGSDSGASDSESLDLNDQKKDGFQTDQIIQNREKEIAPKCHNSSNGPKENEKKADENLEAKKESPFSGNNRKFCMKWNIAAKKVENLNSLTPVQGIWEQDVFMSHAEFRRLPNAFELLTSVRRNSSNSTDEKTQAEETPGKMFDNKEDIFHGQIQTKASSIDKEINRCTSKNGMTPRHDSSRNDIRTHAEETQEKTFKVKDECSREELCEQEFEESRELSSSFKKGNENLIGSKESEVKIEDCTKIKRPRHNSQNTNKSIKNENANILILDCSSNQERSLKKEGSKIKTSSPGFGFIKDSSPCSSSYVSQVERFPKHKKVLSHNEEKKAEKLNSVTKCSSSERETKNLATTKKCLNSGIASDESAAFRNHKKRDVHNDLKNGSREAEDNSSASKQTLLERKTCKVNEAEKETRNDGANRISNRLQTRQSISLEKEHGLQKKSARKSISMDDQSARQSQLHNEEDGQKSSSQSRIAGRSFSPKKESRQRKPRESRSREREAKYVKQSRVDSNYYQELKGRDYRSRSTRRSASPERERWQRKSRESTSMDRESKYSKPLHLDNDDDDDWKSLSRHRASPERGRWQRKSPERASLHRERKRSHVEDDDDYESNNNYYRSRNPRRSVSPARERWQRKSRERKSPDRKRKRSHVDNDDDNNSESTYCRSGSPRRSASPARERWQRKSPEKTSLHRESKWSHVDNDDDFNSKDPYHRSLSPRRSASPEKGRCQRNSRERTSRERDSGHLKKSHEDDDNNDWKGHSWPRRDSRQSASLEKEHWQGKSRERTSMDRESRRSRVDNDDDDDWKTSSRRRYSRRSASLENERRQRTSRESESTERESEHAVGNSRNRNERTFRSPVPRSSRMRQDQQTRRRLISESPDMSWIHNIVVKIADPPRFPIRKRHNQIDRRFIQHSKVERSRNTTDEERRLREPSTSENKSENDTDQRKKRRWTYDDYTKRTDGSLQRKRVFNDEEEDQYAWKRYDDGRTMPYQGYADSQVQSLLKQLCGDYLTKLYSIESSGESQSPCHNVHGNDENVKNHRSWFMTSSEWIFHGVQDTRAEDLTKQTVTSKDPSTTTTATVPVVWYTVPLLISTKDKNDSEDKTKTEKLGTNENENENQAKTDKLYDKKEPRTQKESLTNKEKVAIQTSPVDNNQNQKGRKQKQPAHSNTSEETAIDSSASSESFSFDSLGAIDSWNTSTSCNDGFVSEQMARNDLLVMVTPSSYWYEKQLLHEQKEKLPKEENKTEHHPSLYIPTSFSSSRLTNVSSYSMCFHCDTSEFEFSPQILDSSDVDEKDEKTRKDPILEHATTPQTGRGLMESNCNNDMIAKRRLNFDSIEETPSSDDIKTGIVEDDKTDPIETIQSDRGTVVRDKTVDSVCGSDSTSKKKIMSTGSSIQNSLPKMDGSSSRGTISSLPNLKMPSNSTANESKPLEYVNSNEENRNSDGKRLQQKRGNEQQFVEEDNSVALLETTNNRSPTSNIPQKKIEKKNDHHLVEEDSCVALLETINNRSPTLNIPQKKIEEKNDHHLVEEDIADVFSQKNENNSPRTSLPRKNIGMDIASPSMLKVVAEDPKCKAGEEIWELALKSTSKEKFDELDNQTLDKGTAYTKSYPKSGDLDVAVVKPSPRQKYGTALSETSETFANVDSNVNIVNPANAVPENTQKESGGTEKILVRKKQLVSQIKVTKNLEYSKNSTNSSRCFPSSASGPVASTPHDPLQSVPKRPPEGRLNLADVTSKEVAAGISKKLTKNVPHEILPGNLQHAWGADVRHGAQGPHIRLLQTSPHFLHQDQYGHSFQTPNPQQQEENHMTQAPFYNKVVVQHHNMNNDHPSTNTSLNVEVMPLLSNHIQTLPEQKEGNRNSLLRNQTVFINDPPLVVNQQHAMMPKRDIRPGNDSYQGLLLEAQNNLRPSMPPFNDPLVAHGVDRVHAIHPLRYPTVTAESVYFLSPEHRQQQLPFQQQQIHFQQQQQQLHLQHQQKIRREQQIQYHRQQQRHQQNLQQQQHNMERQQQKSQQQQQQQQQRNSQQQLQQQRIIPDGTTPINQQQAVATQPPRHYPMLKESSQLEKWHDDFLKASINQENLSHIPWGQHALDLGYRGDLRMFPQYRQIQAPLPSNAPSTLSD